MKFFLSILFLLAWVAGEAPRLVWKEILPIRPMDAAAAGLATFWVLTAVVNKSYKDYKNYIHKNKKILAIAGVAAASWILGLRLWPLEESLVGLLYLLRTMVYFWLIWRVKEILGEVRRWIPTAMAAFVGLGFLQYIFLPDTRFLLSYGWDEHYWRLIGTVLDPNYFGVMAGMMGLFVVQSANLDSVFSTRSARNPRSLPRRRYLSMVSRILSGSLSMVSKTPSSIRLLIPLTFIALILTFSRASWIAFWAAAGWWVLAGRSRRLRILGIFGVMVWWVAPRPGGEGVNLMRTSSIEQRLVSWNQAIEVWKQHPWVGVGFKDYGSELPSSSWLVILQSVGIIGTIGVIVGGIRVIREIGENRFWMAVAIMLGIHAIFNNTLFYPPVLGLVAMMRAMDAK